MSPVTVLLTIVAAVTVTAWLLLAWLLRWWPRYRQAARMLAEAAAEEHAAFFRTMNEDAARLQAALTKKEDKR